MDITVTPISGKKAIKDFIHVTRYIYRNDPNFIQPLTVERLDVLLPDKNPYYEHAEVQLFLAHRHGQAVGRISAHIDTLAQEKWGPDLCHFGFFEAEDFATAEALLQAAQEWAKSKGMKKIQGPWSFSANEECGMLIDGFDTPPFVMMPHGKPDYKDWMETLGYAKAKDLYALYDDFPPEPSPRIAKIWKIAQRNKKLSFRQIDMKRFDAEVRLIMDIFNDAWSSNWGYVQFTEAEIKTVAKNLKMLIKPYRTYICEYEGEAAGFLVTIPDINHKIRDLNGKLFPFGIFKLLWRMSIGKDTRVRVPLMGVRKKFQGTQLGGLMPIAMIESVRKNIVPRGSRSSELGWILEDNKAMINMIQEIGGSIYKTMRIWEKSLN